MYFSSPLPQFAICAFPIRAIFCICQARLGLQNRASGVSLRYWSNVLNPCHKKKAFSRLRPLSPTHGTGCLAGIYLQQPGTASFGKN